jgi:phosphohistidine phosphatase
MEIYLMQHGEAVPEEQDAERPLSPEGIGQIEAAAAAMRRLRLRFDAIIASPKQRARQTAAIVAAGVGFPVKAVIESDLFVPAASPEPALKYLTSFAGSKAVFLAGHLPSLMKLASSLLAGLADVAVHFEHGGLCRIDVDTLPTHAGVLRWALTRDHLRLIAAAVPEEDGGEPSLVPSDV